MSSKLWKRPSSVPFPSTWRTFQGKTAHSSGKPYKFRIQDVTEDLKEDILQHLTANFLRDEPTCEHQKVADSPESVKEFHSAWREVMSGNVGLVCLVDNVDELNDPTLPRIVGCNMTFVRTKGQKLRQLVNKPAKNAIDIFNYVSDHFDCFEHYNVNEFLFALGLSVDRFYRGQGVGLELLRARFNLCRAMDLKLTVTAFSAIASQTCAHHAGFVTHVDLSYDDWKPDGEVIFNNMLTKTYKLMAATVEEDPEKQAAKEL